MIDAISCGKAYGFVYIYIYSFLRNMNSTSSNGLNDIPPNDSFVFVVIMLLPNVGYQNYINNIGNFLAARQARQPLVAYSEGMSKRKIFFRQNVWSRLKAIKVNETGDLAAPTGR